MEQSTFYEALADLLEYPDAAWISRLISCGRNIPEERPQLRALWEPFYNNIRDMTLTELQEIYTQAFDLSPVCALEVGYHLFGENYKRGLFLAHLRQAESACGLGQNRQLPDYLPVLLRLLVKMEDQDTRTSLACLCLLPALEKMEESLRKVDNIYAQVLQLIRQSLRDEFPDFSHTESQKIVVFSGH